MTVTFVHSREQFERERAYVADHNVRSGDIVKLSIGGEPTDVARSTLTQLEDSMLSAMFSGRHQLTKDDTGRVFLGRDPKYFSYVLDHLRNGCPLPARLPENEEEQQRVREEFDYFQVPVEAPPTRLVDIFAEGKYTTTELEIPPDLTPWRCEQMVTSNQFAAILVSGNSNGASVLVWNLENGHTPRVITPSFDPNFLCAEIHASTLGLISRSEFAAYLYDLTALDAPPVRIAIDRDNRRAERLRLSDRFAALSYWDSNAGVSKVVVFELRTQQISFETEASAIVAIYGDTLAYLRLLGIHRGAQLVLHNVLSGEIVCESLLPLFTGYMPTGIVFLGTESRLQVRFERTSGSTGKPYIYLLVDPMRSKAGRPIFELAEFEGSTMSPDGTVGFCSQYVVKLLDTGTGETVSVELGRGRQGRYGEMVLSEKCMLVVGTLEPEDPHARPPVVFKLFRAL